MKTKIKIAAIFTFSLFALTFFMPKGEMQTKQIETAGQKFKSIKVLNDMPADQMGKVMNMMAASLGVNCKFCHASNDGDYEKEGFEHKDTARQMLKMTFEMNKNYFEGRPEINCNSCHQGKAHPQPSFPLKPTIVEERPAQPDKKPSVDEILAKYETALGGRANLAKITSRQIKANRVEPDGRTFEAEEILQKGNKLAVKTIYPSKQYGDYVLTESFDGTAARKVGNGVEIVLKADESEQIKREAQLFVNPNLKLIYPKIDFRFVDKIDGREVFVLSATTAENIRERLYFDAQTGLLVRRAASTATILGNFVYQVDYADYKDFGGVKLPTTINFAVPNIRWTRKILDVKNNAPVDGAKFGK
jgi:photosynthetic reaction center cytochrome c subunit